MKAQAKKRHRYTLYKKGENWYLKVNGALAAFWPASGYSALAMRAKVATMLDSAARMFKQHSELVVLAANSKRIVVKNTYPRSSDPKGRKG